MKNALLCLSALLITAVASCGGSSSSTSTAPTISSVKDAGGNVVATTGSTVTASNTASFSVTFDSAMSDTSVTTANNITIVCGTTTSTLTVAVDSTTANTYTITPSATLAGGSCTLTFTANITNSSGTALTAATYTFTVGPSISSLKDAGGNALTAGTTANNVTVDNFDHFILTFSEAMDDTTVTNSNVTMTCSSGTITVTFTVAVESATDHSYRLTGDTTPVIGGDCTLTVSKSISDPSGLTLGTDTSYSITIAAGTTPTVSVTKADYTPALTSTAPSTRLSGTTTAGTLTATFDKAMDTSTVTATNITLTCSGVAQTLNAITMDTTKKIATITPSASLTGYASCTLSFGTAVKDSLGDAMAATSVAFNTECATNDDFVVDTLGLTSNTQTAGNCWTYYPGGASKATYFSVNTSLGVMKYNDSEGTVDFGNANFHGIEKTFSSTSFTAVLEIQSAPATDNACGIMIMDGTTGGSSTSAIQLIQVNNNCTLQAPLGGSATQTSSCSTAPTANSPLYLKVVRSSNNFTGYYKYGTNAYAQIGSASVAPSPAMPTAFNMGIYCTNNSTKTTFTQNIGSFTVDGTTATGPGGAQY